MEEDGYGNMFVELPKVFHESALIDRFHGFIKGWNIPRMNDDLKACLLYTSRQINSICRTKCIISDNRVVLYALYNFAEACNDYKEFTLAWMIDVYKRQALTLGVIAAVAILITWRSTRGWEIHYKPQDKGEPFFKNLGKVLVYKPYIPVSYTHLDVYKRQQMGAEGIREAAICSVLNNQYLMKKVSKIRGVQMYYAPVSYTHLDVYKRQAYAEL